MKRLVVLVVAVLSLVSCSNTKNTEESSKSNIHISTEFFTIYSHEINLESEDVINTPRIHFTKKGGVYEVFTSEEYIYVDGVNIEVDKDSYKDYNYDLKTIALVEFNQFYKLAKDGSVVSLVDSTGTVVDSFVWKDEYSNAVGEFFRNYEL